MKKSIGIVLILTAACILFSSCKSKPKKNDASSEEKSEVVMESETEAAETEKKTEKESTKTNYTGWISSKSKDISEAFGIVYLKAKAKFGSYTLSVVNDIGKKIPVVSSSDEYTTNAFYLKNSHKTYCLTTDNSVKKSLQKKTDGMSILYSVPNVADVVVDFKSLSTDKKAAANMLKIVATVTNTGKRDDDFYFKAILDTVLGEADSYHFYTWEGVSIKNEVLYRTLQNQKWFISKNNAASMQLFFSGADCTVPSLVAFANYSTLEENNWEPDMASFRAFDTVLSYNNSAVCAIWNPLKLEVGKSGKVIFYIAFAVDGAKPDGEKIIYSEDSVQKQTPVQSVELVKDVRIIKDEAVTELSDSYVKIQSEPEQKTVEQAPDVDYYIQNLTPDHLTNEYIQSLLDRIAALEEDSTTLNRQELIELNAELDAILTYLGQ